MATKHKLEESAASEVAKKAKTEADSKESVVFPVGRDPTAEELNSKYLGEVLFDAETLKTTVTKVADAINADYTKEDPNQVTLVVPILKGAFVFAADLLRQFRFSYEIDFLNVSSYGEGTESSGVVQLLSPMRVPIKGRHVLIVEDLVDSGITLDWARKFITEQEPASLRVAVCLNKHGRRAEGLDIPLDYFGAHCPNKFIVGYGMDFAQQYRCLPYIAVLKPEAYKKPAAEAEPKN